MNLLVAVTVVLFTTRLYAATRIGFGDSEALYASWAAHPQPAYLDHPGLLALVARALGEGTTPTPLRAHLFTSVVATILPWIVFLAARVFGAEKRPAAIAAAVVAVVPEIAVGLFGLTPDLLLAPLWLGSLALANGGLRAPVGSPRGVSSLLAAGLLAGIASASKVSGLLLGIALAWAYVGIARSKLPEAKVARSIWPWAGLGAGFVVVIPIAIWEIERGAPMLRHRLFDSQRGVPFSNAIAALGGQLIYVSPVLLFLAYLTARHLVRRRAEDGASRLLFAAFAIPFVPLLAFSVLSPVAEPHWIAPALLALPLHAAARMVFLRKRLIAAAATAAAFTALAHLWVLVPASASLFPRDADPKVDIASELYGWPAAVDTVRSQMASAASPFDPEGRDVVVVGPHWTICGQLHAAMPGVRVGCATPIRDDFDGWLPRASWRDANDVVWVTDNRFASDGQAELPRHVRVSESRVRFFRGGRVARVFSFFLYTRRATSGGGSGDGQALREAERHRECSKHVDEPDARRGRRQQDRALAQRHDETEQTEDVGPRLSQCEPDRGSGEHGDEDRRARVGARREAAVDPPVREDDADELETRLRRSDRGCDETECVGGRTAHTRGAFMARATLAPLRSLVELRDELLRR
jgi:hypothetical protein